MGGRLWHEEDGQTLIEYGMLAVLVGTICVAIVMVLGRKTRDTFIPAANGTVTTVM